MRTRKWLALLLVLVMSLTMGGMTALGDEPGDAGTDKLVSDQADSTEAIDPSADLGDGTDQDDLTGLDNQEDLGDPNDPDDPADSDDQEDLGDPDNSDDPADSDNPADPDDPADSDDPSDTTEKPDVKINIHGESFVTPVKAGDTVSYTVEIETEETDMTGWYLLISDRLKAEIANKDPYDERVELTGKTATVTYSIPKDFFITSSVYSVNCELTDGKEDGFGGVNILAEDYSKDIKVVPSLESHIDFSIQGIEAGKEYPFTVTWVSTVDYAIENFSTEIWTEICGGDAYEKRGEKPTYKITECPAGAAVKQGLGSATVEKMTIPKGGTIKIAGTVLYPAEALSGTLHADEILNGEFVNQLSTLGFKIGAATDGKAVIEDKATGITVSGVETGVTLSVKSVSKEQQAAIEELVKKLLGNTKGIKIFDISLLKDGKEVQPGTPVKVTIPVPNGFSTNLKLYHQNEKGELEAVDISVKDSIVSFEAKSFSPYVLVDLGASAANSSNTRAPQTGDTSSVMLYLMLALAAMGSVGFVSKRRING